MRNIALAVLMLTVSLTSFSGTSFAAEDANQIDLSKASIEDILLMQIPKVVTASKYEQSIKDTPSIMTVITKEEIEKFGAINLHDILNRSVSVMTSGNYLNVDGITSIRGDLIFGQDLHVLLLMNGRPLRESIGGYNMPIYEGFPVEAIERIEIVRGPGSVLYGTNAYAGVINIITKKAEDNRLSVTAGGGSFGTLFGSVMDTYKTNDLDALGVARYFDSTGWAFTATGWRPPASLGPTKTEDFAKNNYSLTGTVNYKDWSINVLAVKLRDAIMNTTPVWPATGFSNMSEERLFLDVGYKYDLSDAWYLNTDLTLNYHYMEISQTVPATKHVSMDYLAESTLFGRAMDDRLNVVFGALINKLTHPHPVSAEYPINPVDQNNFSSYLQLDYKFLESVKASAGVQYNQPYTGFPGVVPRVGAVVSLTRDLGLKLSYAEAFRSPYPIETDINASVLRGNPNLKPENVATTDVQLFYNKEKSQTALTYYHSRYFNMIVRANTSTPGVTTYTNSGGVQVDGLELEQKYSFLSNVNALGSYAYQTNKSDSGIQDYMPAPQHMLKAGVIYSATKALSFGLFDQYYSKPPDIVNSAPGRLLANTVPDAYNWLTLNVSYKVSRKVELSVFGTNLLNQEVFYPEFGKKALNSIPGEPGTAVYVQAKITL